VFTELLPGNGLLNSVIIFSSLLRAFSPKTYDRTLKPRPNATAQNISYVLESYSVWESR
jgi:hypothetical protein